jgi:O-antigen/teichoic acid export membrane protein
MSLNDGVIDDDRNTAERKRADAIIKAAEIGFGYGKSDLYQYTARFLLVLNGGAILAVIGFLGNFADQGTRLGVMASGMKLSFMLYVVGAALSALLPSVISEYYLANEDWQKKVNYSASYFLVIAPTICFILGSYWVIETMSTALTAK